MNCFSLSSVCLGKPPCRTHRRPQRVNRLVHPDCCLCLHSALCLHLPHLFSPRGLGRSWFDPPWAGVKSPHTIQLQEVTRFHKWAENNAIIPTEFTLPYFQCAPISISTPTFVQKNDTGILQIKEVCDNTPTTPKRTDRKYATVA